MRQWPRSSLSCWDCGKHDDAAWDQTCRVNGPGLNYDYLLCPRVPVGGGSLWVRGTDGGTEGEREGVFTWLQLESFPVKGRQDYLCNII